MILQIAVILALAVGCASPAQKKEKLEAKKEAKQEQLSTNKVAQVKQGAGMADAALHVIRKNPSPTIYDDVATMSLETSLLAFQAADVMPPSYEILKYRKMVDDLISTNAVIKAAASNQLQQVRATLAATEHREQTLSGELGKLQAKLDEVNAENAALATTWSRLKHLFWWIVWGVVGVFVIRLVAAVLPPPYNSFGFIVDHIIGFFAKGVFAIFSKAKDTAGVVAKDAYELSESTLKQVVEAVQQARSDKKIAAVIDPILKDETDKNSTRLKITEVKKQLGYV